MIGQAILEIAHLDRKNVDAESLTWKKEREVIKVVNMVATGSTLTSNMTTISKSFKCEILPCNDSKVVERIEVDDKVYFLGSAYYVSLKPYVENPLAPKRYQKLVLECRK